MTFLNFFLVGFVVLGAVPVVIHILMRRRFKIVVWAAMEFLLATLERNQRRLQLRDIILMLLRAFAIVFLALALARPTLSPGRLSFLGHEGESAAVVVLDNSLSMGYHTGGATRFERARRMAKTVVDGMPKGSSAAFVLMSDTAVDEIPEPTHDLVFAGAETQRARLTDAGTSVLEGLSRAWEILKKAQAAGREVYLITDMQAQGWPAPDEPRWKSLVEELRASSPRVRLYIINAGGGATENVSVDSLEADDEMVTTESTVGFTALLRNHGPEPVEDVVVDLYVGDSKRREMRKAATVAVDKIEDKAVHSVRLETRLSSGGEHRIEARIRMDRLAADNSRHMALEALGRLRVLLIDGDPAEKGERFGGETDFLKAALSPIDYESPDWKSLIRTEVTTVYGLGGRSLRDYHAVVLANVEELPPGLVEALETSVKAEGRGLIVFVGDNVRPERYNQQLYEKTALLPGKLLPGRFGSSEEGFGLATDELSHPIVAFFGAKETQPFLAKARFFKAIGIEPSSDEEAAPPAEGVGHETDVVARFTDGRPAIVERKLGRGSVVLFASTADKAWTDFPLRPAYLPVVKRAVQHVTLGRRPRKNLEAHDRITDILGVRDAGEQVSVRYPKRAERGGREVQAALSPGGDIAVVEITDTDVAGFYEFTVKATEAGQAPRTSYFAVNPPPAESNLEPLTQADLSGRYPNFAFNWVDRADDLQKALKEERVGREIWPIFIALVFICLAAETILALLWAPRETSLPQRSRSAAVER